MVEGNSLHLCQCHTSVVHFSDVCVTTASPEDLPLSVVLHRPHRMMCLSCHSKAPPDNMRYAHKIFVTMVFIKYRLVVTV